MERRSAATNVV